MDLNLQVSRVCRVCGTGGGGEGTWGRFRTLDLILQVKYLDASAPQTWFWPKNKGGGGYPPEGIPRALSALSPITTELECALYICQ